MLNTLLTPVATGLTNRLMTALRNRTAHAFNRDEYRYMQISFSQFGEDLAVLRWVERLGVADRLYVDAGCFHPVHCSNTLLLHKRGWRGINVDVDEDKIARFRAARPADHSIAQALSSDARDITFLRYDDGLTNRLQLPGEDNTLSATGREAQEAVAIRTATLDDVLAAAPWPIEAIGYLNIDCEGHDFDVLSGLSLRRYRPRIITIEALTEQEERRIDDYLARFGYMRAEKINCTVVHILPN